MVITDAMRQQLAKVTMLETAIAEIVTDGVSYSIQGSHSVSRANLPELRRQLSVERKTLLAMTGRHPKDNVTEFPRYV